MPIRLKLPFPWRRRSPVGTGAPLDAAYYQFLHEAHRGYRQNNWLADDIDRLAGEGRSVLELGCGNGRFLERALGRFDKVCGCDWAVSPVLCKLLARSPELRFFRLDVIEDVLPGGFDIACSADFLEHLPPDRLDAVLAEINACAPRAYHKIACFDDGHSHLSIFPPEEWLGRFLSIDAAYRLHVDSSRGTDKTVAILSKGLPLTDHG
jgi:SAM-dependent methyltransferase